MFNEWERKILDQLKNNHRSKLTRIKPHFGPGMSSPSEASDIELKGLLEYRIFTLFKISFFQ
jgi:hypothetical protein